MRGNKSFDKLFDVKPVKPASARKGRNDVVMEERHKRLAARMYYYGHIKKVKYELILQYLAAEFDYAVTTIPQVQSRIGNIIAEVKAEAPTVKQLRHKYPWMVWAE